MFQETYRIVHYITVQLDTCCTVPRANVVWWHSKCCTVGKKKKKKIQHYAMNYAMRLLTELLFI
jgi:hypothetical protein